MATTPAASVDPVPVVPTVSFVDQTLQAVNAARAVARRCGTTDYPAAGPLTWQFKAEEAARVQADYLQQNNLFGHDGANGSTVADRLSATGFQWSMVGENLAAGYPSVQAVVQAWLASPGHCANIMNAKFTEIGMVMVKGSSSNTYNNYWAMVLDRPL